MKKNICKTCLNWIDCGDKGFCLIEPLFTYTAKNRCSDYSHGSPSTDDEYEQAQQDWLNELRSKNNGQ